MMSTSLRTYRSTCFAIYLVRHTVYITIPYYFYRLFPILNEVDSLSPFSQFKCPPYSNYASIASVSQFCRLHAHFFLIFSIISTIFRLVTIPTVRQLPQKVVTISLFFWLYPLRTNIFESRHYFDFCPKSTHHLPVFSMFFMVSNEIWRSSSHGSLFPLEHWGAGSAKFLYYHTLRFDLLSHWFTWRTFMKPLTFTLVYFTQSRRKVFLPLLYFN